MRDALTWIVTFADGSELAEYDADGGDHGFAEVDARAARVIRLVDADGLAHYAVALPAGQTPVFFRRRTITLSTDGSGDTAHSSATCLGWDGAYLWIYEDGSVALTATRE